jgi:hypothetical protein
VFKVFFKFLSPFHHFTPLKKALKKSVLQTNLYSEVKFRKNCVSFVYKQLQTILFTKNLMYVVEENRSASLLSFRVLNLVVVSLKFSSTVATA